MQNKYAVTLAAGAAMTLLLASPLLWADEQDISKVNGAIRVESGRQVGSVETVNGSIVSEDSVRAERHRDRQRLDRHRPRLHGQRHRHGQRLRDPGSQHQGRLG